MILRLSCPEGIPSSSPDEVKKILAERSHELVRLEPGTYDLTPSWWEDHARTYTLQVHAEGVATLRVTPRHADVMATELSGDDGRFGEPQEFLIGQGQSTAAVAGLRRDGTPGVFEIIIYRSEQTTVSFSSAWLN